jgi:hypothetical protein
MNILSDNSVKVKIAEQFPTYYLLQPCYPALLELRQEWLHAAFEILKDPNGAPGLTEDQARPLE